MELRKKDFIFLRHGETQWNVEGKFQGQTDIALNEVGSAQALECASSKTAQLISEDIGHAQGASFALRI